MTNQMAGYIFVRYGLRCIKDLRTRIQSDTGSVITIIFAHDISLRDSELDLFYYTAKSSNKHKFRTMLTALL